MNKLLMILTITLFVSCTKTQPPKNGYQLEPVSIKQVELTDNFWLPIIKTIQQTTIKYGFDKCHDEGRMDNFLIAGGKLDGKTRGKMPFDDTDLYKLIEGASYSLISYPDTKLENYLDSIIDIIKIGQEPDGYLTTWFTIDPLNPPAPWVQVTNKRWHSNGGHELYNSGHLFEAAAAHYRATGKRNFLDIAIKNADLLVKTFKPGGVQIPPDHQIAETGLIKLYQITGNTNYLNLSKYFLDLRGDSLTHKLGGEYSQDHMPVVEQTEAVGHAVRAVYMYAGMTDIAAIKNDPAYRAAIDSIWNNIVEKKMYITGGIGSRHDGEAFGQNYELPNNTAYNETCAAIGNVQWNHRMFLLTGNSKYYDIIERTLYNGLISGISLDGKKFFYPNPLESDGKYNFNHGACTRQGWFDCSCCPTNLVRFLPTVPELIYATQNNNLYINLFASNTSKININSNNITIKQQTNYPWQGKVAINIETKTPTRFTVKIRVPGWALNKPLPSGLYSYCDTIKPVMVVMVNGLPEKTQPDDNGYIAINRNWTKNNNIEIELPMKIRKVVTNNIVKTNNGLVAFEYGPLVYCAEQVDNTTDVLKLTFAPNASLTTETNNSLLGGITVIAGNANQQTPVMLIPYYAWANRGITQMKVWFNKE